MTTENSEPPSADMPPPSDMDDSLDAAPDDQPDGPPDPVLEARTIENELNDVRERYLRLAAEYDNFRKRTDRERLDARDRAQAQLVQDLLSPLDDLSRVSHFTVEGTSVEALLEGVQLVEKNLMRALESAGLEKIEAEGQRFDPELHEAVMMTPTEAPDEDETVGEVFQPGYCFRGALLRPARVQVRQHGG